MSGKIRLGCIECDRNDFDGIEQLPSNWEGIDKVQTYEDSIKEIGPDDSNSSVLFWQTHMGICPDCQKENV